jgi:hypothetical protein
VRACNADGCGGFSPASTPVIPYGTPIAPTAGATASGTTITFSWTGGGGNGRPIANYQIKIDNGAWQDEGASPGSMAVDVGCGQTRTVRARIVNQYGTLSAESGPAAATTPDCAPVRVNAYDNYVDSNGVGRAMCRGNPGRPESMPGGTASQTFTVGAGVAAIDEVLVWIDPDDRVTGHGSLYVNGAPRASANATAAGDTTFSFSRVSVAAGDQVTFSVTFTATLGKLITVYTTGSPGGRFVASNSCSDGAPNVDTTSTGLKAVVHGWNR